MSRKNEQMGYGSGDWQEGMADKATGDEQHIKTYTFWGTRKGLHM